jgi:hypothetical protein
MRISHRYKYVYLANMRAGSRLFRDFLYSSGDESGVAPSPISSNCHDTRNQLWHHTSAANLREYFVKQQWMWEHYYVFTNTRNPWDRMATLLFNGYYNRHKNGSPWTDAALRTGLDMAEFLRQPELQFVLPIDQFTSDPKGFPLVQEIIPVEKADQRLPQLARDLSIPNSEVNLTVLARSPRGKTLDRPHYSKFYTEESVEIVRKRFASDIHIGGYEFTPL